MGICIDFSSSNCEKSYQSCHPRGGGQGLPVQRVPIVEASRRSASVYRGDSRLSATMHFAAFPAVTCLRRNDRKHCLSFPFIRKSTFPIPKHSINTRQRKIIIKNCPTRNYMS